MFDSAPRTTESPQPSFFAMSKTLLQALPAFLNRRMLRDLQAMRQRNGTSPAVALRSAVHQNLLVGEALINVWPIVITDSDGEQTVLNAAQIEEEAQRRAIINACER